MMAPWGTIDAAHFATCRADGRLYRGRRGERSLSGGEPRHPGRGGSATARSSTPRAWRARTSVRASCCSRTESASTKRDSAGVKMRLMGRGWQLYRGLEREDSTVVGRHDPFIFFEFALITPLVALAASGQPPSALAQGPTPVAYTADSAPIALLREIEFAASRAASRSTASATRSRPTPSGMSRRDCSRCPFRGHWTTRCRSPCRIRCRYRLALSLRADKRRRS